MDHFILVEPYEGTFRSVNKKTYKASTALKAANKVFRDNKHLEKVYVYNKRTKTVHSFSTKNFFLKS